MKYPKMDEIDLIMSQEYKKYLIKELYRRVEVLS